jgi:nitrogen regulatory protein P-II 1
MQSLVTAIIKPPAIETVKEALKGVGASGITVTEVKGFGRQGGHTETYRGAEYQVDFVPKVRVEIITGTEDAEKIAQTIMEAARTGQIGDGKIWITTVDRLYRIRTGEMGDDAI